MFERFTEPARRAVVLSQAEAHALGRRTIGTEHLLLGLLREGESTGAVALAEEGVGLVAARARVQEATRGFEPVETPGESASLPFSAESKRVLASAVREALGLGHNYVGTEHLVLGLLRGSNNTACEVLDALGVDREALRADVYAAVVGDAVPPEEDLPPGF